MNPIVTSLQRIASLQPTFLVVIKKTGRQVDMHRHTNNLGDWYSVPGEQRVYGSYEVALAVRGRSE